MPTISTRLERRAPPPPCPPCEPWPERLEALLTDQPNPWQRHDGGRYCPDCGRNPPTTITLEDLLLPSPSEPFRETE